ncbi:hypothetical protein HYV49_04630 [Candidatus Pacearchaeota archaeon]|nr:hypothetical protein [Candidatus Pacearchaeota archaeon]
MEKIISLILKSSLFPILTEALYSTGNDIWEYNKLTSLVLYLTGFILTTPGSIILTIIIILYILKTKDYI